jgi:hypothetical protein
MKIKLEGAPYSREKKRISWRRYITMFLTAMSTLRENGEK